jgi:hypothetical protein
LRERSWRRLSLQRGKLRLEGRKAVVELPPELIDLLLNLLRLLGALRGCVVRGE